jgi:hypothetical protein
MSDVTVRDALSGSIQTATNPDLPTFIGNDGSLSEAYTYFKAIRTMAFLKPQEIQKAAAGGQDVTRFTPDFLNAELNRMTVWIAANQTGSGGTGYIQNGIDENFRGY